MEATPPPPKMQNFTVPRRDGRVKAQIFKSVTGSLSSAAAKALTKLKSSPAAPNSASTSAATSTTASPPPSAYASDGFPDHA